MLVLAPTRELAMQSQAVLSEFGAVVNLSSIVIYGGVPKHTQKDALRKGVDCVVGTPGRLKDLINDGSCKLGNVCHLVLDEADRMVRLLYLFVCYSTSFDCVLGLLITNLTIDFYLLYTNQFLLSLTWDSKKMYDTSFPNVKISQFDKLACFQRHGLQPSNNLHWNS